MTKKKLNILLVEDNIGHVALIYRALEAHSNEWQVEHAKSLDGARKIIEQTIPDLMLLDNRLPDGRGVELLPGTLEASAYPIILLTAFGDEKTAVETLKSGALDYIVKSDQSLSDLPRTITRSLREWRHISEKRTFELSLARSEERYRAFFDIAPDSIVITRNRKIENVNQVALELFGLKSKDDILGSPVMSWVAPGSEKSAGDRLERLNANSTSLPLASYSILRKDGEIRDVEAKSQSMVDDEGIFSLALIRDVTERNIAEKALRESQEKFRNFLENLDDIVYTLDTRGIVIYVNKAAEKIVGMPTSEIIGQPLSTILFDTSAKGIKSIFSRTLYGEDTDVEGAFKSGRICQFRTGPLRDDNGNIIGITGVARDITDRVQARRKLKESSDNLVKSLYGTIDVISKAVEVRDPYTHGHMRRVADIACAIAQEMKLDEHTLEGIRIGAMIHDIGKIQTPSEILTKPTRLSKFEFELVKGHAQTGFDILKGIEFPWPVAAIAHQHHERLNGTGYPQGLKGDEICLEARIVAVADVIEAMGTDRPYRPALDISIALEEIRKNSGELYDPIVADTCLRLFEEGRYSIKQ